MSFFVPPRSEAAAEAVMNLLTVVQGEAAFWAQQQLLTMGSNTQRTSAVGVDQASPSGVTSANATHQAALLKSLAARARALVSAYKRGMRWKCKRESI
jgi:hypothetical protein